MKVTVLGRLRTTALKQTQTETIMGGETQENDMD
uniref:Uncharacterized protein n=1 Tax=Trichinella nativa TaxID=6335 RepID=A0A0V1KI33_9BILA